MSPTRLLIVEDELDFAAALCIGLRLDGYSVWSADSVKEALEVLKREAIDLVITDWALPDGTAAQVCLSARAVQPAMPIIVMSGVCDMRTQVIADCKPNFYVAKPLSIPQLFSNVRALVQGA
ncbi:MAG TPA: response regulator [Abditibacteriaceae bacterium]|jgi:DNA-binding response OmpR family regulator